MTYQVGKGQVIWWGDSAPLTNGGIRESGNLPLFLNSIGPPEGVRVLWDEYFHGAHGTLWSLHRADSADLGSGAIRNRVSRHCRHILAKAGADQCSGKSLAPVATGVRRNARRSVFLRSCRFRSCAHRLPAAALSTDVASLASRRTPPTLTLPTAPARALAWNEQKSSATLSRAERAIHVARK